MRQQQSRRADELFYLSQRATSLSRWRPAADVWWNHPVQKDRWGSVVTVDKERFPLVCSLQVVRNWTLEVPGHLYAVWDKANSCRDALKKRITWRGFYLHFDRECHGCGRLACGTITVEEAHCGYHARSA
ncbi:hypothetical protein IscW_ISCW022669 [Ixodes scapularis]|uniref:Uncharacterized protein n=1 Tax=Ixodes scapularis TaxID=6945 RepID=B7QF87_IXOSC|nr:hypothetical protein IscW_ISCW022669 [Ixodes scapularis]|eukprot:XP_002414201.1 hypothetical protein IscW_ISCW022669 [Ixodes scapularis]